MVRWLNILLLFISLSSLVEAKEKRVFFVHYTTQDGLCSNSVNAITQDTMGFMWIATVNGASRFDGNSFDNYRVEQYPEIYRNDLQGVFVLPNGKPTLSSSHSVLSSYDYESNSFSDISDFLVDTVYKYHINGFEPQGETGLLSTARGVYRYDKGRFVQILPQLPYRYVLDVTQDSLGRYWLFDYDGASVYDEEGECLYDFRPVVREMIDHHLWLNTHSLLLSSPVGSLWLVEFNEKGEAQKPVRVNIPFKYVSCMVKDVSGNIWMGTLGDGLWLVRYEEKELKCEKVIPTNNEEDALSKISSLYIDNQSNVWISTLGSGVWRTLDLSESSYFSSTMLGIPSCIGSAFSETSDGDILFGTDGMGVFWLDADFYVKRNFTMSDGLSSNNVTSIERDADGSYLIGYWGGAINRLWLPTGKIQKVEYNGIDKPLFTTKSILQNKDGVVYVASAGDGIYMKEDNRWQRLSLKDSSMNDYEDLWTESLLRNKEGNVHILSSRTIWSNVKTQSKSIFKSIYPDIDKSNTRQPLHFNHAVEDDYLYVASNEGVFVFNQQDSLLRVIKGDVVSIQKDNEGLLWVCGAQGIHTLKKNDSERVVSIMTSEELPSSDFFSRHASWSSASGRLFFGTKEGFVCINPANQKITPFQYFEFAQLVVKGEKIMPKSPLFVLDYNETHFRLDFDLIDYSLINKPVLQYRILELDSAWNSLGEKREVEISYLPSGNFHIEVKASTPNGEYQRIISQSIKVLSPWWHSVWFRLLLVLLVALSFYLALRLKTRRVEQQKVLLSKMVDERTEELRLVNENLSQKNDEIAHRNESLLESLKQKDQLVSIIGHDLKNPMFAVVSTLKRLLTKQYTISEQQNILSEVTKETETLQNEMVKLLQWSAESSFETMYQPQDFDLMQLVSETVSFVKGLVDEKAINLQLSCDCKYETYADPRMVSTIVRNLLTNAIKFTPTHKSIDVYVQETESVSIVRVVDQGMGMTKEQIDSLLKGTNRFSTQGTEEEKGFGLGFQIVMDFVKKNLGEIEIESIVGEGTEIKVAFPLSEKQIEKDRGSSVSMPLAVNVDLLQGKSILVVDDDPLLLSHISEILSQYVSVYQAKDGEEAVHIAMEKIPDLILSDIEMPNMNGFEMYEALKENMLSANIPLMFLSAKSDIEVRQQSLSLGAISFIAKPFEDSDLMLQIVNFLTWQQKKQIQMMSRALEDKEDPKESMNPLLERLLELVKENYQNPDYTFNDIAVGLGMSKSTLSRRLKSLTDKTPIEILSEYRFSLAKKMVEKGDMPISEIAYSVGFSDPSYFSRRFKELFGVTPSSQIK